MKEMRYTELFYSLQGEGLRVGVPSIFLRLFGCNFECKGFSNPEMKDPRVIPAINLDSINEADLELGCDSRYSWHKDYRNLALKRKPFEVANELLDLTKEKFDQALMLSSRPRTHGGVTALTGMVQVPDWVITGGEPFMQQEQLQALLEHAMYAVDSAEVKLNGNLPMLTFETNASLALKEGMVSVLEVYNSSYGNVHFSNSPKLSFTGEMREQACKPKVIEQQSAIGADISFKFVVRPEQQDFDEVCEFIADYAPYLDSESTAGIYVMPVGASLHQQQAVATKVAELAMAYGLSFSPRLQCDLWANKIGT